MIIFQCSLCGDTAKAELQVTGYEYESNKNEPSMYNMPTHPFNITVPDFWAPLLVNGQIMVLCPYCPKAI